jgi:WD40 repeat protein
MAGASIPPILHSRLRRRGLALAEGVLHALFASKIKMVIVLVLTLGAIGAGTGAFFLQQTPPPEQPLPVAAADRAATDRYGDPLPPDAVARMGTVRFRQALWNGELAFAPDGKAVVSTGQGTRSIVFWDVATGRRLRQIETPEEQRGVLAFGREGKLLASVDRKGIRLWDTTSGKEVRALEGSDIRCLAFSPDGKTLATGGADRSIRLWDVDSGKETWRNLSHERAVETVLFAPDGKTLLSAGSNYGDIYFWDVSHRKEIRRIRMEEYNTQVLALSPDGKILAAGGRRFRAGKSESRIRWFDTSDNKELRVLEGPKYGVNRMTFSPDGKLLAASDGREELCLWEAATGREVRRIRGRSGMAGQPVFSPDGKTLATRTSSVIRLLDVATGKPLHDWPGHDEDVCTLAFSDDGKLLASGGRDIRLWTADSGEQRRILPGHVLAGMGTQVRTIALTPDGQSLISAGPERTLRRRDLATGKETGQFLITDSDAKKDKQQVLVMNLSADGKTLAAFSTGFGDPREPDPLLLSVWDVASGKRLAQHRVPQERGEWGLFLPDNRTALVPLDGKILVRDVVSERTIFAFPAEVRSSPQGWAVSHDGKLLAVRSYSLTPQTEATAAKRAMRQVTATCVQVWELDTGKQVLRIPTKTRGNHLAFSPDGKLLAGDDDRALSLWDVASGEKLHSFRGFEPAVRSLAFSFDGKRLASGLADGTALVWDLSAAIAQAGGKLPKMDEKDLETLWSALAAEDAPKAHAAIARLASAPNRAVPFLAKRLQAVAAIPEERIRRLLADLDSADFTVRETATRQLEKLGERAKPALHRHRNAKPSAEVRKRIETLLAAQRPTPKGEEIRRLRAIRVLEAIGSTEARRILTTLATGAPAAQATTDAQAALERLRRHAAE